MNAYKEVAKKLIQAQRITVLTGAGISTSSGIPDFRSKGGLYDTTLEVEFLLSEINYKKDPSLFWESYKYIFGMKLANEYKPNSGHLFLKELEDLGKEVYILTQNVDGLHRSAGNRHVYELHGTINKAHCPQCRRMFSLDFIMNQDIPICPDDLTVLKPDVVLFGGMVKHMQEAYQFTCETDVFMVVGTSLNVYPVNELPTYIQNAEEIQKIIVNNEPTAMDNLFNHVFHEDINQTFKMIEAYMKENV